MSRNTCLVRVDKTFINKNHKKTVNKYYYKNDKSTNQMPVNFLITRGQLKHGIRLARHFLIRSRRAGIKSSINRAIKSTIRIKDYTFNWNNSLKILNTSAVTFMDISDNPKHWAETDGESISINPLMPWSADELYWTLLHEALHGLVRRNDGSEVSELREHQIMAVLNPGLVSDPNNPSPWL